MRAGGDGVDEIGARVGGLVGAAEVAGDGGGGVVGDAGRVLSRSETTARPTAADGVVAFEEGEQRRVETDAGGLGLKPPEDRGGEQSVGLEFLGEVGGDLGEDGN